MPTIYNFANATILENLGGKSCELPRCLPHSWRREKNRQWKTDPTEEILGNRKSLQNSSSYPPWFAGGRWPRKKENRNAPQCRWWEFGEEEQQSHDECTMGWWEGCGVEGRAECEACELMKLLTSRTMGRWFTATLTFQGHSCPV